MQVMQVHFLICHVERSASAVAGAFQTWNDAFGDPETSGSEWKALLVRRQIALHSSPLRCHPNPADLLRKTYA